MLLVMMRIGCEIGSEEEKSGGCETYIETEGEARGMLKLPEFSGMAYTHRV